MRPPRPCPCSWAVEHRQYQGRVDSIPLVFEAAAKDLGSSSITAEVVTAVWNKLLPGAACLWAACTRLGCRCMHFSSCASCCACSVLVLPLVLRPHPAPSCCARPAPHSASRAVLILCSSSSCPPCRALMPRPHSASSCRTLMPGCCAHPAPHAAPASCLAAAGVQLPPAALPSEFCSVNSSTLAQCPPPTSRPWFPGLLERYDAPYSLPLIAPRPMLVANGELDPRCPMEVGRGWGVAPWRWEGG